MNSKAIGFVGFVLASALVGGTASAAEVSGTPYQVMISKDFVSYSSGLVVKAENENAVPAGKRLIVENISYRTYIQNGHVALCYLDQNGKTASYFPRAVPTQVVPSGMHVEMTASFTTRVYLEEGSFRINCNRYWGQVGTGWLNVIITGTLVNAQ